jgi:DNA-binding CsgD family transcriptional regulator
VETSHLTATEIKIIQLICRQYTSREIAEKLGLSFRTIEDYRTRIQAKTKSRNMVGVVLYALKNDLFRLPKK